MEDLRQQVRRLEDVAEGAMARVIQADRARSVEGRAKPDPEPGEMSRWMVETLEAMASGGGTVDDGQESPRVSEEETRGSDGRGEVTNGGGAQETGHGQNFGGTEMMGVREVRRAVGARKARWKAERARAARWRSIAEETAAWRRSQCQKTV